jgi:type II secretory ATPase GspE/PulE/Tfp pilus assembly ATPase PilB-like protein
MPDAIAPGAIGERKYRGRVPIAEFVTMNAAARGAILGRADADTLQREFAGQAGYRSLRESASDLVSRQVTDSAEVDRVLGTASLEGR